VHLLARHDNVLDGTPLLDIKPYVPDFDVRSEVYAGGYDTQSIKD
jgi:tRNA (Thr-GGU) A37 N-methylase